MRINSRAAAAALLLVLGVLLAPPAALADELAVVGGKLTQLAAQLIPGVADKATVLAVTRAGKRLVAVGDHGVVLLSDDKGKSFRQAKGVPTRVTLTSVSFVDERSGWAVGHWGTVLHTTDGGEHWEIQRDDRLADRPLLSVLFLDQQNGYAAGIWSTFLATHDGGRHWETFQVPAPPGSKRADLNLFHLFDDGRGGLFVCAERGLLLHAGGDLAAWSFTETGSKGSLWTGLRLADGTVLVGGLLGRMARSSDQGASFAPVETGTESSITAMAEIRPGLLVVVGLDGVTLSSLDGGQHFSLTQRDDRLSLTAVGTSGAVTPVLFSKQGVVRPGAPK
jgi:photosystem II stability/assembly factor-like uncharacterized protein